MYWINFEIINFTFELFSVSSPSMYLHVNISIPNVVQDANQKSCNNFREQTRKFIMEVATWNVKSSHQAGKVHEKVEEMK